MNMSIKNGDINVGYCYINSSAASESNNHNSIDYTKKRDENYPNIYVMENNGFPDGVGIDVMLPAPTINQCDNM